MRARTRGFALAQCGRDRRNPRIIVFMTKHAIKISDTDAASDSASLLDRVREGAEVIIERDAPPVAVVSAPETPRGRLLSDSIALAEKHAKELGHEPTMDPAF